MNLSGKGTVSGDRKLSTTLNPNAAEFIPSLVKTPSGITNTTEVSSKLASFTYTTLGKGMINRSQSLVSNNSDEDGHKYWHHHLPDDITPDFKDIGDGDFLGIDKASQFQSLPNNGLIKKAHHLSSHYTNGNRYPVSSYGDDLPLTSLHHYSSKPLEKKKTLNNDQLLLSKMRDAPPYYQKSRNGFVAGVDQREFLASLFPDFAVESLAEVYFLNGCNLNLTIEVLRRQLELQVDGGSNKKVSSKALLGPVHNSMDFPALSTEDNQTIQQITSPYHSSEKSNLLLFKPEKSNLLLFKPGNSIPSGEAISFTSAVRQVVPQDTGSSRSSNILASSYQNNHVRGMRSYGSNRAVPAWLETGEAIANMYPEMEEARDHARLRNSYIEQDLSPKGQLHHLHTKASHGKVQDSIYRQRNPIGLEIESNGIGRVPERTIDLLGMQMGEALHVLKHELSVLRNAARSVDQIVHVYICVGLGHQNHGSYTHSRLPFVVQRFLLDEEGLDYSEPQPGVFRVVVY